MTKTPGGLVRLTFSAPPEVAKEIEDFWHGRRFQDQAKAILALVRLGLRHAEDAAPGTKLRRRKTDKPNP